MTWQTAPLAFTKMHGLGNDFVVVDARARASGLTTAHYRAIGDRRTGIGFDQFLTIEPARNGGHAFMRIHNPDGTDAEACGNGTRCVAAALMAEAGRADLALETVAGTLLCARERQTAASPSTWGPPTSAGATSRLPARPTRWPWRSTARRGARPAA